jgi:hypothetical protein
VVRLGLLAARTLTLSETRAGHPRQLCNLQAVVILGLTTRTRTLHESRQRFWGFHHQDFDATRDKGRACSHGSQWESCGRARACAKSPGTYATSGDTSFFFTAASSSGCRRAASCRSTYCLQPGQIGLSMEQSPQCPAAGDWFCHLAEGTPVAMTRPLAGLDTADCSAQQSVMTVIGTWQKATPQP